jgi:predicted ATPase
MLKSCRIRIRSFTQSAIWINCGQILKGWGEICRGEQTQGIELLQSGVVAWQQRGALTLETEAYLQAGRADAALVAIEDALKISKDTGENWATAEVLRVKAGALQAQGRAKAEDIETILVASLEVARGQQARSWELRPACDLGRLWQRQGRGREALKLLQSVYDQFTEGFDTTDLKTVKALIGNLKRSRPATARACSEEPKTD